MKIRERKICYKIQHKTRAGPNAGIKKKLFNSSVFGIFGPPCNQKEKQLETKVTPENGNRHWSKFRLEILQVIGWQCPQVTEKSTS